MSVGKVVLSIIFPPLAVYDKGCGSMLIVGILTIFGWIPGVIAALVINNQGNTTVVVKEVPAQTKPRPSGGFQYNQQKRRKK